MKKVFRKNQLIITTLAVMLAVAGYLNYSNGEFGMEENAKKADGKAVKKDEALMDTSDISYEDMYAQANDVIEEKIQQIAVSGEAAETFSDIEVLPEVEEDVEANSDNVTEMPADPGTAVLANSTEVGAVAQARLTREQTRAKNREVLEEIVNNAALGEAQKQEAVQKMITLTEYAEKESAAEILLEAKGFADAVVSMQEEAVDVVIYASELTDVQRAQIEDIVKRKTGIEGENIVITPVQ